jgi:putative ABC transport system permease protein
VQFRFSWLLVQGLRMLRRDWRSGELRLLAIALTLAVAAVSSVGFFVDRVRAGFHRDAALVLGADAVLESDHPIDPAWFEEARARGLQSAFTETFPSVVLAEAPSDATLLVALKAVSANYPLHGAIRLADGARSREARGAPPAGTAWVDAAVLPALDVRVGDTLRLGQVRLRIDGVIAQEPDRLSQMMSFASRMMINDADLPASGLIQPGSRISYRWLIAGEAGAMREMLAGLKPRIGRGQHLQSLDDARPDLQRNLERADRFLGLATLVTVLVAAVAIASAAQRFSSRRVDTCALMRCMGCTQPRILALFAVEFIALGLLASLAGVLAGLGLHLVLLQALSGVFTAPIGAPSPRPAIQGLACGMAVLLGFALAPLEQLRRVAPLRALRRDLGDPPLSVLLAGAAGTLAFGALLAWTAGDAKSAAISFGGFLGFIAAFAGISRLALFALRALRGRRGRSGGVAWRFALDSMQRRAGASVAQAVGLSVGIMALLLLAIVRTDLVDEWRGQAPADAPNRFLINVQPDQVPALSALLREAGIGAVRLEPMVRGRLVAIDGRRIGPQDYPDPQASSLVEREFNLSYRSDAPPHNTIVSGAWFAPGSDELSIEEGIAKRLGIALGQRLRFDVAGEAVEARVGSIRKVNWDSMRVNFFVIMDPTLLRDAPQTFITSFHLPPALADVPARIVRAFPNITVIDTDLVVSQLRGLLDQLVDATQFLFVFALGAGVLVLYSALLASQDVRKREAALLRALGATRRLLARAQAVELLLSGALAGLLAALGAVGVAWALARFAFEFEFVPHPWVAFAGIASGTVAAWLGGWAGLRAVLRAPPLGALRDTM